MIFLKFLIAIFCLISSCFLSVESFNCMNEHGKSVDWWVIMKIPDLNDSPYPVVQEGQGYMYLDADNTTFSFPNVGLNKNLNGALGSTLAQVYNARSNAADVGWLFYNDQDPSGGSTTSYGHSKGVMGFTSTQGFWLVHSVPHFPVGKEDAANYTFPDSAERNGQSMLCVSFATSSLNALGDNLLLNKPKVYSSHIGSQVQVPKLQRVIDKDWNKSTGPAGTLMNPVASTGGRLFMTFAKNKEWNSGLYSNLVAPKLKTSIFVETWMNGSGGKINSTCNTQYKVVDVTYVRSNAYGFEWKETKDHSKWAVAVADTQPHYSCIGDINRMESQFKRGGGTVCLLDTPLYKAMNALVYRYWPC